MLLSLGLGCRGPSEVSDAVEVEVVEEPGPRELARARLAAFEDEARTASNWAERPSSDGRFGADPYRLVALDETRTAVLLQGADELIVVDSSGEIIATAPTPPDPRDLAIHGDELLVVGTGAPVIARYDLASLEPRPEIALASALAPRALAVADGAIWVADEGHGRLHHVFASGESWTVSTTPHCRGPVSLDVVGDLLVTNCLLEHRVRFDRVSATGLEPLAGGIGHDGPIWSVELGPQTPEGARLLALTGVEDHPLERRDGGFGYIDSFVWIYALDEATGTVEPEPRATVNLSELGVVTPKWSRWLPDQLGIVTAGYATAPVVELSWPAGFEGELAVEERPGLPGTHDVLTRPDGSLLATNPLLDRLVVLGQSDVESIPLTSRVEDDRSFDERLGELLVYTSAMAPWNSAEGKRSRFTCETCHFEGRGDGRVHFTGREFEGEQVFAVSKPLLGLFVNRPHFSRALDRSMAVMVDNEFGVANRHNGRDPWFSLGPADLPWLAEALDWPDEVDGEDLRRALMAFLMRWSMPTNPSVRGRTDFTELEAEGARAFAERCEGCHQARLVADLPETRVSLASPDDLEPWRALIFSDGGPIVWASDAYVQTSIRPWVHAEGARVPSLRRLLFKRPYFTNGKAKSLAAVLEGVRLVPEVDHALGPVSADEQGLGAREREALLAFLRLL